MTQLAPFLEESVPTTQILGWQPISVTGTALNVAVLMHATFPICAAPVNHEPVIGTPIGSLIAKRERDPRKAEVLARARKRIGELLRDEPTLSLTRLRLEKGLSQAKLAEMMRTQQPYIARIESGSDDDIKFSTMEKFAEALEVDVSLVCAAIKSMREVRGRSE